MLDFWISKWFHIATCSYCCSYCWGNCPQKSLRLCRFKWDRDAHRLMESDFIFDATCRRFTKISAATRWVHAQRLPAAYASASACSYSTFILVISPTNYCKPVWNGEMAIHLRYLQLLTNFLRHLEPICWKLCHTMHFFSAIDQIAQ